MNSLTEHVSSISMKFYMTIGAILGGLKAIIETNGGDIALTFVLGFIGAIGAGVAKIVLERIVLWRKKKKNKC